MADNLKLPNDMDFGAFLQSIGLDREALAKPSTAEPTPEQLNDVEPGTPKGGDLDIEALLQQALGNTSGKGMDDDVPATIEGAQPAALSEGEYVIPADVVSLLGDGNSKAGAKVIEELLNTIRKTKTGKTEQPAPMQELLANGK